MSPTFKSTKMGEFPSEIMFNIFSRLPVKSLARFRCVSKQWCNHISDSYLETMHGERASNDRMLIMFQQFPSDPPNSPSPCKLSFLEYKDQETGSCTKLEVTKKPPLMEFMCKDLYSRNQRIVLGSCNGLLFAPHADRYTTTLIVINPLRKECYELPPIPSPLHSLDNSWFSGFHWSCGLGFDDSTKSFKMVCISPLCTMVHVLGSDSWRKIPLTLSLYVRGEGVYANGCIHWRSGISTKKRIIRFDVKNEEFGYIELPRKQVSVWVEDELIDFLGQVGYVYTNLDDDSLEVWVLKEGSWVMKGQLKQKPRRPFVGTIRVLGLWNENGDILVNDMRNRLFIWSLNGDRLYEAKFDGWEVGCETNIQMYQSSLFSTSYSIRK